MPLGAARFNAGERDDGAGERDVRDDGAGDRERVRDDGLPALGAGAIVACGRLQEEGGTSSGAQPPT